MSEMILSANFRKRFAGGPEIIAENFVINGGVTVLFGASGSGKTTILRCLAGLERPDAGSIRFQGETWFDAGNHSFLPPRERSVGFVPQDYALFPHLTVAGNVSYGLKELSAHERDKRVMETAQWLGLDGLEKRLPRELSGGQQQRVALARAVVRQPKLLLLDEPFAALDAPTRIKLRGELKQLLRQLNIPTILVTHDRTEAIALGEHMMVVADGQIQQSGLVPEVLSHPSNLAVAQISGMETILSARVLSAEDSIVTVKAGDTRLVAVAPDFPEDVKEAFVCIRAEDVMLVTGTLPPASARNRFSAVVISSEKIGPLVQVEIDCGFRLKACLTPQAAVEMNIRPRASIGVLIKAPHVHLIANR